jgi:hypothetical protein
VRRLSAVFALSALAAATVALAQQTTPQPQAQPPASTTESQTPSDPNSSTSGESGKADKQALMKDCLTQVRAANPGVPERDIKDFCTKEVNSYSPHD